MMLSPSHLHPATMNDATTHHKRPASVVPCEVLLALSRSQALMPPGVMQQRKVSSSDSAVVEVMDAAVTNPTTTKPQMIDDKVKDLSADRLRLRGMLEERMKKCQVNESSRKIRMQAAALEKAIYAQIQQRQQQQQSEQRIAVPHDEASLNEQLRQLYSRLTHQRHRGRAPPSRRANTPRSRALLDCLGRQRYLRLQSLLEQIQHLGVGQNSCASSTARALQGHTPAPQPIRQLFFQTRLLSTVNQTPVGQLPSITHWDELLDEAERHIDAYQTWAQQHYSNGRDPRQSCCLLVQPLGGDAPAGAPRAGATDQG